MKPQRFNGPTIQKVQAKIRAAFGDDALIYSIRTYANGVEILAGSSTPEPEFELPPTYNNNDEPTLRPTVNPLYETISMPKKEPKFSVRTHSTDKQTTVIRHLRKLGFRGSFCAQFTKQFLQQTATQELFSKLDIENSLLSHLATPKDELFERHRVCALVGPSGAGKTTTIIKLAQRYICDKQSEKVGLITSDYCDLASKNQLSYYSAALNLPLHYANTQREMSIALHELRNMDFILIDTYGISQRDHYNLKQLRILLESQQDEITTLITLPCNVQEPNLDEVVRAFMTTNAGGCILTREDESVTLAPVLSVCMNYQLPVSYICSGPNFFGDIEKAEACLLLHHIVNECNSKKKISEVNLMKNIERVAKKINEVSYE